MAFGAKNFSRQLHGGADGQLAWHLRVNPAFRVRQTLGPTSFIEWYLLAKHLFCPQPCRCLEASLYYYLHGCPELKIRPLSFRDNGRNGVGHQGMRQLHPSTKKLPVDCVLLLILLPVTDTDCPGRHLAHHFPRLDLRPPPSLAAIPEPVQSISPARNNIKPDTVPAREDAGCHGALLCPVGVEGQGLGPRCRCRAKFV
jgi:hypothetical protein